MNEAAQVLLIIVSSVLSVFLVILIIIGVELMKLMSAVKKVVARAERIADSAQVVGEYLKKSAQHTSITRKQETANRR